MCFANCYFIEKELKIYFLPGSSLKYKAIKTIFIHGEKETIFFLNPKFYNIIENAN
jgi:hypothetical protein